MNPLKHLQVKSKHHYVQADYLSRWSLNGRDIWASTSRRNVHITSVAGLAVEKRFYEVQRLSPQHIQFIRSLSSQSPPDLHRLHMSYLRELLQIQRAEDWGNAAGTNSPEILHSLAAMKANAIENLHSAHERRARPLLASLAARDLGCLASTKAALDFLTFLAHQLLRTKKIRDGFFGGPGALPLDLKPAWWFVSYMYGMNLGRSLYLGRHTATQALLLNDTGVPFITSDHPVINIHPEIVAGKPLPEETDLYYPLSPQVAYVICDSGRFDGAVQVEENLVAEMNTHVAKFADECIFSSTEASVRRWLPDVRTRQGSAL